MKKRFLILLLLAPFAPAIAQEQTLTLQQALQYTLSTSQAVKKAQLDIENVGYQIEETRAGALPKLTGSGSLNFNPILQLTALPGELAGQPGQTLLVAFGQKWNSGLNVALSQNLFDKSVFTGLKAARSSKEYYQIYAQLTEEQLIEQVASTYYQVLVQQHRIAVLDSTINNTTQVLKVIKGQFESGLGKQIDVDRASVNLSNLQAQRQQLENIRTQLENQLKYAMGMDIQTAIHFPPVDFNSIRPLELLDDTGLDVKARTEMNLLNQQGLLLSYKKEAYKAELYPSLSLTANYGYQGLGKKFPWTKATGVNWFDYSSIGLNLRIPIFNGFATKNRIKQADVAIRKLEQDMAQTSLSLNLQYENAKSQYRNSIIVLGTQKNNVGLAGKVFANTRNNYNNGLASLTDLLDAERSLTDANNNYAASLLELRIAEIQLLKSQGKLRTLLN